MLRGMSMEQVMAARGAPTAVEVIPPDAQLWRYAEGEIAFSSGRVTYVSLTKAPSPQEPVATQPASDAPSPETVAQPRRQEPLASGGAQRFRVRPTSDGFVAVRSQPTTRSGRRVAKLHAGDVVVCVGSVTGEAFANGSEWRDCPDAGGYIYAPLLDALHEPDAGSRYWVRATSDGFVAVRSRPTTRSGRRVAKLHAGDVVVCVGSVTGEAFAKGSDWLDCPEAGGYIYAPLLVPE